VSCSWLFHPVLHVRFVATKVTGGYVATMAVATTNTGEPDDDNQQDHALSAWMLPLSQILIRELQQKTGRVIDVSKESKNK
jgi:hypothetical protein